MAAPIRLRSRAGKSCPGLKPKVTELPSGQSLARVALKDYLGEVYGVEREIKALREARAQLGETLPLERVLAIRQQKSAPLLAAFKD
jgi:hypothetical protein